VSSSPVTSDAEASLSSL